MKKRYFAALAVVAGLAACNNTDPTPAVINSFAAVRYINATPDTLPFDVRFVDTLQNFPAFGIAFRGSTPYQPIVSGRRQVRVFLSSTTASIASTVMFDTTFTFETGKSYTIITTGYTRTGLTPAKQLRILEDVTTAPAAGQIGIRALHLGADVAGIDGYFSSFTTTAGIPAIAGTPDVAGLTYGNASPYLTRAAGTAADSLLFRVAAAGTTTAVGTTRAPVGELGTPSANPIPGTRVAGTVLTAFVFGTSPTGSLPFATVANRTPGSLIVWDRRPPSTAP